MPSPQDLDSLLRPEARDALKHLELYARRKVEGMLHGIHRSRRKGVSTEFDHHKVYQPGDSLKHIDWKVSARHDRYYVKRYIEDTALTVRLVVDRSGSMRRATGDGPSKFLQASRLAACLAYLVMKEHDLAGLTLTNAGETSYLPAGSTERHLVRLLVELASHPADHADNLVDCLRTLLERGERKGMVVLISDLMLPPEPVQRALARLQAQGHEVLVFHLRDPAEADFPFNRWVQFRNLEPPGGRLRVDAVPLKKIYREEYQALVTEWERWARQYDAHLIGARTDGHMEPLLSAYLAYRAELNR